MTAEVFSIGYHGRSRVKYSERKVEREVKLGDSKCFNDRVESVAGKKEVKTKEVTPIRTCQPIPDGYAFPVASVRSEKAPTVDVKGKIADHKNLKGTRRSGGRKR